MPPEISDLFDLVAAPGEPGGPRVIQSLYRHFGHQPAFLALAITLVRQRFDDGSIERAVAEAMQAADIPLVATRWTGPQAQQVIELVAQLRPAEFVITDDEEA